MPYTSNGTFSLGGWIVEPTLNRISRDGNMSVVEPRVMQVLVCLAEQPGEVVTREHLMETVWADIYVSEVTLTRCVSELRKAFDDDSQHPQVIETIRKQGYRLIAPVSSVVDQSIPGAARPFFQEALAQLRAWPRSRPFWMGLTTLLVLVIVGLVGLRRPTSVTDPASARSAPQAVPFTSFPGQEFDPAMVPHGDQVVFAWTGAEGDNVDLYLKQINSEVLFRLTDHSGVEGDPAWSVDSKEIAFVRHTESGCGIFVVPALGGRAQKLADCEAEEIPGLSWSPNAQWIAFADRSTPQEPYSLFLLSVKTQEKRKLTNPPAHYWGDRDPVFARESGTLAFTRSRLEEADDLYLISVEGGEPQRLTHENRPIEGVAWTQDGQTIVFSSNRQGLFDLWRLPVDAADQNEDGQPDGVPTQVAAHRIEHAFRPSISRNSYGLAFEQRTVDTNIWRHDLSRTSDEQTIPRPFITSTQLDAYPQFSPDGERVAFISNRSGHPELWICNREGSDLVSLTSFGNAFAAEGASFIGPPRWSPDGRRLAFEALVDEYAGVYITDVDSPTPQRLTPETFDALAPSWSRDGRWIYFGANRENHWDVWKMPAMGGKMMPVTRQGGFASSESPDGAFLYFTKKNTPGLWRTPLNEEGETRVLDALAPEDDRNWLVGEEGLFFVSRNGPAHPMLAFFDFETAQVTPRVTFDNLPYASGLAISPDGKTLLYTQRDRYESDIMLMRIFYN